MQITLDQNKTFEIYPYLEVGSRTIGQNDSPNIFHKTLPIYSAEYKNSNTDVELLIIASDLQGVTEEQGKQHLIGEKLPSFLKTLIEIELEDCKKIGVLLCGNLYTSLEKRGSSGDVRNIWKEFNNHFEWVIGVAGNQDTFGSETEKEEFRLESNIHLLHNKTIEIDGLSKLTKKELDFILIHETPDFPRNNEIGNSKIREHIEKLKPTKRTLNLNCVKPNKK